MSITVQHICKNYGTFRALSDVSIEAHDGRLLALLGPSGSGKTTLLRIIAGLEVPDSGQIRFRDDDVTGRAARDRNIGFVFQHYALFRHMTVFENVAFGLRVRNVPDEHVRERVGELLHLIRLDEMGHRYPGQLSGGQRQRVALARALAPRPAILLLDEPFGALDAKVRLELRGALRQLQEELRVTTLFVTHDQEEAFDVADEVVVMNEGKVEQAGPPLEVFEHPANAFVMDFLGNVNLLPTLLKAGRVPASGAVPIGKKPDQPSVYVRPNELDVNRQPVGPSSLLARVVHMALTTSSVKVRLFNEEFGLAINVDLPTERAAELALKFGESVFVFARKNRPA
ncbi:MAG: sulfate/molybdate ABC transporter ATP-binding protein [Gemmataceae bacterium]